MSALGSNNHNLKQTYTHVSNTSFPGEKLFRDSKDLKQFGNYLKQYLSSPKDHKKERKAFSINGKVFKGIPHQPKNYFGSISLVAYTFLPDHFHLVVHEHDAGSLQQLMRSLCTRYAIYYNKKYKRKGSVYSSSYKSIEIKSNKNLLILLHYIYNEFLTHAQNTSDIHASSLPYHLKGSVDDKTVTILTEEVQSIMRKEYEYSSFENYVNKYNLTKSEQNLVKTFALEDNEEDIYTEQNSQKLTHTKLEQNIYSPTKNNNITKLSFWGFSVIMFFLLTSLSLRNIQTSASEITNDNLAISETDNTEVLGMDNQINNLSIQQKSTPSPLSSKNINLKNENHDVAIDDQDPGDIISSKIVIITIEDESIGVNLRSEPDLESQIIGSASNADEYVYVSETPEWYEIINNNTTMFVSKEVSKLSEK